MSRFIRKFSPLMAAAVLAACAAATPSGTSRLAIGNLDTGLPVHSMLERRFTTVVRQQYDFSCGSAALATLLRYHYGKQVDEPSTFLGMWQGGDQALIRKLGFSLLDMKRYLGVHKMPADGYQVTLPQIAKARLPGIALINVSGYKHFVVVKGIDHGSVLLGDPATGLRRMTETEFAKSWNGILFVINDDSPKVQATFAASSELALAPGGRITLSMEPVSQAALALTRPTLGDL